MTEEKAEPEPPKLGKVRRAARRLFVWWRDSPRMDKWDRIGLCGLGLLSLGVQGILGWRWAALVTGVLLLAFYYLGEIRAHAAAPGKQGG